MRMPKYIVHRVDVMEDGVTVKLTDVTDSVNVSEEGEWVTEEDSYEIICNKCGYEAFSKDGEWFESDYCPNCGAKMKQDKDHKKKICTMNFQGVWCNECTQFWNCDILTGKAKEQVIYEYEDEEE